MRLHQCINKNNKAQDVLPEFQVCASSSAALSALSCSLQFFLPPPLSVTPPSHPSSLPLSFHHILHRLLSNMTRSIGVYKQIHIQHFGCYSTDHMHISIEHIDVNKL